jgi:hypothetical protein
MPEKRKIAALVIIETDDPRLFPENITRLMLARYEHAMRTSGLVEVVHPPSGYVAPADRGEKGA